MSAMKKPTILTGSSSNLGTSGLSFYRMSDAPPDWAETDPSQPDYIANKDLAEKVRPVMVEGEVVLDDSRESGPLNFVGGKNVTLSADGNTITITGDDQPERVRPISVNSKPFLGNEESTGALNLVAGNNVTLSTDGNTVIISARASVNPDSPGGYDYPELVEGDGIDIVDTPYGQKVVSLEPGAIGDQHISQISLSKLVQEEGEILILNGGKANGNYY